MKEFFQLRSANAILMRGSEGEPTASMQRLPEMHFLLAKNREINSPEEHFTDLNPFTQIDAKSSAPITEKILSGEILCPQSILKQANIIAKMAGLI